MEEKLRRVSGIFRGPCDRKRETVRRYRFGIAYENTAWPGYVTEKIIDCFVAGVVPVYLGAPDVSDYVPPLAFWMQRAMPRRRISPIGCACCRPQRRWP